MSSHKGAGLFRHGILLMAATQVANVCNLLFQAFMGWSLEPEEYGVLASMLGLILVVATPMEAMRTSFAHFASRMAETGHAAGIRRLAARWMVHMLWFSVPLAVAGVLFRHPLAAFFNLDRTAPIVITSLMLAGCPYPPILTGALQGMQSFVWMALSQHSWSVVRLLTGAGLVTLVARRAEWGLIGQTLGVLLSYVFGWAGLRVVLGAHRKEGDPPHGVGAYFVRSLLVLAGFAVLMNADIVMVKHFFPPREAGLFARAGTIGRSLVFLPMPIALAMFPKVTSTGQASRHDWVTLLKSVLFAGFVVVAAAIAFSLITKLALLGLFHDRAPTPEMVKLVRCVIWAMSPLGLVFVLANFEMAQHRFAAALLLLPCAVAYVVGVTLWHASVFQVAAVLAAVSVAAMVALAAGLPWRKARDPQPVTSNQ